MLDHLRIAIPVLPHFYVESDSHNGKHYSFAGDLLDFNLPLGARSVQRDDFGEVQSDYLYHCYETLGTDYTGMAFKFFDETQNIKPHVELKASPLKLLQGHNVYGFDDIDLGAAEMLGLLAESYPDLYSILDIGNAEVMHLDSTFFTRLPHQNMIQPTLDYLENVQFRHYKAKKVKYDNYITFANENARYVLPKIYGKFEELKGQLSKYQRRADKGCPQAKRLVVAMHDVLSFSNACLRFEARTCKRFLQMHDIPNNLWDLINYQRANPTLLTDLWHQVFDPILNTLKGNTMTYANNDELYDQLVEKLKYITPKGNVSLTKANNAIKLYESIEKHGFKKTQDRYKKSTFYRDLGYLLDAGISRAHLQNLHTDKTSNVIPFVRLVEIKFDQQLPDDYVKPTSKYMQQIAA